MNAKSTRSSSAGPSLSGHSRDSSIASTASSPGTSCFSSRNHSRWPSSSSSLVPAAESPMNVVKSSLHDLLEDPAEREDCEYPEASDQEPLCICDTLFCEHQRPRQSQSAEGIPLSEASNSVFRFNRDDEFCAPPSTERRSSDPSSGHSLNTRVSLTWPSLLRQTRSRKAAPASSTASIRSAPPSRSSSKRRSDWPALSASITSSQWRNTASSITQQQGYVSSVTEWSLPSAATSFINVSAYDHEPIEREELCVTPLLPPSLVECRNDEPDSPRSPLQSPSIAAFSATDSVVGSPLISPITLSFSSPSLSTKPSFNSIRMGQPRCGTQIALDALPPIMAEDLDDEWSIKLGHANFRISPEPYVPDTCDYQSCAQLLDDWRSAQVEYWRQESLISEHHGLNSEIYKLAGEKWSHLESRWRSNFFMACDNARANGEIVDLEPFEAARSFAVPDVFPDIDYADIVGPMTQYAKPQPSPTKKNTFLRLLTDPASILRKPKCDDN